MRGPRDGIWPTFGSGKPEIAARFDGAAADSPIHVDSLGFGHQNRISAQSIACGDVAPLGLLRAIDRATRRLAVTHRRGAKMAGKPRFNLSKKPILLAR